MQSVLSGRLAVVSRLLVTRSSSESTNVRFVLANSTKAHNRTTEHLNSGGLINGNVHVSFVRSLSFSVSGPTNSSQTEATHSHSHDHGHSHGHGHSHQLESKRPTSKPIITKTYPLRPWLESPVDLTSVAYDEASKLWDALGGKPGGLDETHFVENLAEKAFQLAVSTLATARSNEDLEETRSLLATAVTHGNPKAKLYCARLFLIGEWPIRIDNTEEHELERDEESDKRSAKEKGMEVIRQIRAIQKKRKKGERYDAKPPKDLKQSMELLRDLGSSCKDRVVRGDALMELGDAHFFPEEDDTEALANLVSAEEALKAYETAAKACQTRGAWYRLGSALMEGSERFQPDTERAKTCFQRAIDEEDDPDAHFYMGHLLRAEDSDQAMRHLLHAAEAHQHRQAMVYLARMAMERNDDIQARKWLLAAEKLGDPEAIHLLADAYLAGTLGFEKDLQRALRYYRMAGAAGSEEALLSAGAMHYDREEFEEAFKCYEQAAETLGSVEAWRRMAHLYLHGQGVTQSKETAMRILELIGKSE